jgi:hypothetical protein
MFSKEIYTPTMVNNIKIYEARLEIPDKYYDIGTIKFQGEPIIAKILEIASEKGADAVIKEFNNFILIRFKTHPKENQSNETKTI